MEKAYEILSGRKNHCYMYASRRSIIVPSLWRVTDLTSVAAECNPNLFIKLSRIFDKFGLEEEIYFPVFDKYNVPHDYVVSREKLSANSTFIKVFNELEEKIRSNSKKEYEVLVKYFKQIGFDNKKAVLIDIGWNGSMQKAINRLVDDPKNHIRGYYVGYYNNSITNLNAQGFLINGDRNNYKYTIISANPLFEGLFLAPHGSVKNFSKDKDGSIKPIFYDYEYADKKSVEIFKTIQNAALDFCRNLNDSDIVKIININRDVAMSSLEHFAFHPTMSDVEHFGDLDFFDYEINKIAKPKKFSYYLLHPKNLINDLRISGWKIGFLKRLTRVNLMYDKLFTLAAKICKY